MHFPDKLRQKQADNNSLLCIGLDTDVARIPEHIRSEPDAVLAFNRAIIRATADIACCYKLNTAFYEQYGAEGFSILAETLAAMPAGMPCIADAKRGDIGNTSAAYAQAFFRQMPFDALTVNPYLGGDSVEPFLREAEAFIFLLALTSNKGSADFQRLVSAGKPIYRHVVERSLEWGDPVKIGFVVGATHPQELEEVRSLAPHSVFLIPGVGTQGGDAAATVRANGRGPALINVSRSVLYASSGEDFADRARDAALAFRDSFNKHLAE